MDGNLREIIYFYQQPFSIIPIKSTKKQEDLIKLAHGIIR